MYENIKIHIIYFSGTGGTALAAKELARAFSREEVKTRVSEIFQDKCPEVSNNEILILMYPVYAADAPTIIYDWIKSIDKINSAKAIIIAISGGGDISPNTASKVKSIKQLEKKGCIVTHEYMLCMPSNFIAPTPDELAIRLIQILPKKCELITKDILENDRNRKNALLIDRIMLIFFALEKFGSKIYGKTLVADDNCNNCSLCAKNCPRANIVMKDGKPKFGWKCILCMRCLYNCPKNSIRTRMPILKKATLKEGFCLNDITDKAKDSSVKNENIDKNGLLWSGIMNYLHSQNV